VGTVEPLEAIGTDRHGWASYTAEFAEMQKTLFAGTEYAFTHFHKTNGYANAPLDGIWARAPYLHNGAVPTLRDLLEPPEARPQGFYHGYDVYDRERLGFVSTVASEDGGGRHRVLLLRHHVARQLQRRPPLRRRPPARGQGRHRGVYEDLLSVRRGRRGARSSSRVDRGRPRPPGAPIDDLHQP
jgi:hypothetical protein